MNIALVGTGNMGQAVRTLAMEQGHAIVARFDASRPLLQADLDELHGAHIVIDFSLPEVALGHIERYCKWGQPAVIGTTGWYDEVSKVQTWVNKHDATLLYAPNFSIGVALMTQVLGQLATLLNELPDFDVALHEIHHTQKVDSPSGTALHLAQVLLDGMARKTHLDIERQATRIDPAVLHVSSSRLGSVFGEHIVSVDSPFDQLTLTHRAKNRDGFAYGALKAAEWLHGRPPGLYTLHDMLAEPSDT